MWATIHGKQTFLFLVTDTLNSFCFKQRGRIVLPGFSYDRIHEL